MILPDCSSEYKVTCCLKKKKNGLKDDQVCSGARWGVFMIKIGQASLVWVKATVQLSNF